MSENNSTNDTSGTDDKQNKREYWLVAYNEDTPHDPIAFIESSRFMTVSEELPFNGLKITGAEESIKMLNDMPFIDSVEEPHEVTVSEQP